jgi:predicted ferric reductase
MGGFFVLSFLHYFLIMKPLSNTDPVGFSVLIICLIGVASYLFTLAPYGMFRGRSVYTISDIDKEGSSLSVTLEPKGKGFHHQAGQFAFVRFAHEGTSEVHPFTISQAANESRTLRFTVKPLGDDTRRFARALSVGQSAKVSGPFGHFKAHKGNAPSVWIAAGVGITPFVAFAGELADHKGPVDLVYCVREEADAAHLDELRAAQERYDNFNLHLFESGKGQRLTADSLDERLDVDWSKARVSYCGPEPLRESLKRGLIGKGLKRRHFAYEAFEIRSGIGLRKLAGWVLKRIGVQGPLADAVATVR